MGVSGPTTAIAENWRRPSRADRSRPGIWPVEPGAGTPEAVIASVRHAVVHALNAPAIREKLAAQIMEAIPTTPAEFRARIDADIARWTPVIRAANIKVN